MRVALTLLLHLVGACSRQASTRNPDSPHVGAPYSEARVYLDNAKVIAAGSSISGDYTVYQLKNGHTVTIQNGEITLIK